MTRGLALLVGLALAVGLLVTPGAAAPAYSPDVEEYAFLGLINDYRAEFGLAALTMNATLGAAADYHSQDMATYNYFAHTLADGTDAGQNIYNHGYSGSTWGENIAAGMAAAPDALVAWQNSPSHDAGMRNPAFQEIGVGRHYQAGTTYGWYWTTTFGGGSPLTAPVVTTTGVDPNLVDSDPGLAVETDRDRRRAGRTANGDDLINLDIQQEIPGTVTTADGQTVYAAYDGTTYIDGNGQETMVFGDLNLQGDPVVYEAPSYEVIPAPVEPVAAPPADPAAVPVDPAAVPMTDPAAAPVADPAVVSQDVAVPAVDPAAAAPATSGGLACGYPSWLDAQLAFEGAGGLAADPGLVAALDPDYDGIACEEAMTT